MPFIDVGLITHTTSSLNSYMLKEQNSNNIRTVSTTSDISSGKFDFTFGVDLCFHLIQYWGIVINVQYDRFNATSCWTSTNKDYHYPTETIQSDKMGFKHKNVLASIGMFVSF